MTVALAAITYLDRVCIAHAAVTASIKNELGLTNRQMGLVFSAFTLAYALFEIPTGAWGDRVGTRRVLTPGCSCSARSISDTDRARRLGAQ